MFDHHSPVRGAKYTCYDITHYLMWVSERACMESFSIMKSLIASCCASERQCVISSKLFSKRLRFPHITADRGTISPRKWGSHESLPTFHLICEKKNKTRTTEYNDDDTIKQITHIGLKAHCSGGKTSLLLSASLFWQKSVFNFHAAVSQQKDSFY